jgi:putative transcriptional regulator
MNFGGCMIEEKRYPSSLKGQFLIAMPSLPDPNFSETVTLMVEHTEEGGMGLVVNRKHPELVMADVFKELELEFISEMGALPLYIGGPVHTGQIFILHGAPFNWEGCRSVNASIALSNTKDVLIAIAQGNGPGYFLVALGCAGWGPGQLESEIMANSWLTCEADTSILFEIPEAKRWKAAASLMGIDTSRLMDIAGHA